MEIIYIGRRGIIKSAFLEERLNLENIKIKFFLMHVAKIKSGK